MGQGVSFMLDEYKYHGAPLSEELYRKALQELGLNDDLEVYRERRSRYQRKDEYEPPRPVIKIQPGAPIVYEPDVLTDNRSAWGKALESLARENAGKPDRTPMAVLDCDLASSVKTEGFAKIQPDHFFQGGIQEHNTATVAGALSTQDVMTFFSDFNIFGVVEAYNQQRLNDINFANLKLVCTHAGTDIGEDGKTHQCIDYIGLLKNVFGFRVIVPADPNQTDRVIRYVAQQPGNVFVGMGRSKTPVILDESGKPFFGPDYVFRYGQVDWIRKGKDVCIITMGALVPRAMEAFDILKEKGVQASVLNLSCPKEIPRDTIEEAAQCGLMVSYEDHNVYTGLGSSVANALVDFGMTAKLIKLGIRHYASSGKPDALYEEAGLSVQHLVKAVLNALKST
jgi:transketolase